MMHNQDCTKPPPDPQAEWPIHHFQYPITPDHERHEARIKTTALIGTKWEAITVTHTFSCCPDDLAGFIADLMSDDVHEIRTNRAGNTAGCLQGIYWAHPRRLTAAAHIAPSEMEAARLNTYLTTITTPQGKYSLLQTPAGDVRIIAPTGDLLPRRHANAAVAERWIATRRDDERRTANGRPILKAK